MGCSVSRFEGNGTLKRLQSIKARRRRPLNDSTHSRKQLLSHEEDVKLSISSHGKSYSLEDIIKKPDPPKAVERTGAKIETAPINGVGIAIIIAGNNYGIMKVASDEKSMVNGTNDDMKEKKEEGFGDDVDEDEDERMIGYGGGGGFAGSPSFRIYFKENLEDNHNEIGKSDEAFSETILTADIIPRKDLLPQAKKKVERERRKRCFRKVLPKRGEAAVKNLLNMKSCCS